MRGFRSRNQLKLPIDHCGNTGVKSLRATNLSLFHSLFHSRSFFPSLLLSFSLPLFLSRSPSFCLSVDSRVCETIFSFSSLLDHSPFIFFIFFYLLKDRGAETLGNSDQCCVYCLIWLMNQDSVTTGDLHYTIKLYSKNPS